MTIKHAMAHIFIVCLCRNKCNILKPYIIYNELCTIHIFVSVLCSITNVIMLLAIDATLLKKKKSKKLEGIPLQDCVTGPIISLTSKIKEGDSDITSMGLFFTFTKDIFIKCLYAL